MTWQWWKEHIGWVLLVVIAGGAPKVWNLISSGTKGFVGVSSYLRTRQKEYVKQLVIERNQLQIQKDALIDSHAKIVQQLTEDLESMTRAKDLREDISRQDRETVRDLMRLCDEHKLDYGHLEIHVTRPPY